MKEKIRKIIREHKTLKNILQFISIPFRKIDYSQGKCKIINHAKVRIVAGMHIHGKNNEILINDGCVFSTPEIRINGNNNKLVFEKNCIVGRDCSFWMEGNNLNITIGEGTTFTQLCHLNAQEDGTSIIVGKDCMFSNNIIIRTSDSHPIYDLATGKRTNKAENIIIGNHVWIAPNSKIMKGGV